MVLRKKEIAIELQKLSLIDNPKVELEQYCTPPDIAAEIIHAIGMDINMNGKRVLDLGCGSGMLGLGSIILGASEMFGVDVDEEVLKNARCNGDLVKEQFEEDEVKVEFYRDDVRTLKVSDLAKFDVAICNPPFGTRESKIDQIFVEKGLMLADVVYSVHKYSTRNFWKIKAKDWGVRVEYIIPELLFPVKKTFSFHKHEVVDIQVQLIKFCKL